MTEHHRLDDNGGDLRKAKILGGVVAIAGLTLVLAIVHKDETGSFFTPFGLAVPVLIVGGAWFIEAVFSLA